jgi:hypothetical protein
MEYLGLHNKPTTAVHPEHQPTSHLKEEEDEDAPYFSIPSQTVDLTDQNNGSGNYSYT